MSDNCHLELFQGCQKSTCKYLHSPTISLDNLIWTVEVHTPMNDTCSCDVRRKQDYR